MPGMNAAAPRSSKSPSAASNAGAMHMKYTGVSSVCASLKLRASAPIATMTDANRNAAGGITSSAAAPALAHGSEGAAPAAASFAPSRTVIDIEARLSTPDSVASVATATTLPVISAARAIGADSVVSRVLRSRSPAVMSIAGWNAPSITITTMTSGRIRDSR